MAYLSLQAENVLGKPINLASPQQIATALYQDLRLPYTSAKQFKNTSKEAKSHPTTNEATLRKLSKLHKLPHLILEFRQTLKIKSTWVSAIINKAVKSNDGRHRIHSSWNSTKTATGRLSSSDPNLQNLPRLAFDGVHGDPSLANVSIMVRDGFVSCEGHTFVSADYCQIELRLAAHMSNDQHLIDILVSAGERGDVFQLIAASFFRKAATEVSSEERQLVKRLCYGILYGQGKTAMAEIMDVSASEVEKFLDCFFFYFPNMKVFVKSTIAKARSMGCVTSLLGRTRPLPNINSLSLEKRAQAERQAVNTKIQGSAADIIKLAMVAMAHLEYDAPDEHIWLMMEIHDELVFEVPDRRVNNFVKIAKGKMENVATFRTPLIINIKAGKRWGSMEALS